MIEFLFSPEGRIGRGKFWLGTLLQIVIGVFILIILSVGAERRNSLLILLSIALMAPQIWIGFCLSAKRFHDRGKSAWFYLTFFIPLVSLWFLIECLFFSGEQGDNDYGPPPNKEKRMKALAEETRRMAGISDDEPVAAPMPNIHLAAETRHPPQVLQANGKPAFGKRA